MFVLVRESPRAAGTELRFASKPCAGEKAAMDGWRDAYNASRTSAQLKREGKVVSVQLTEQLAQEYRRFRSEHQGWVPLEPPAGIRPVALVEADEAEAEAAESDDGRGGVVEIELPCTHEGGYPMQPTLHGRKLAFVSEGDLWLGELPPDTEGLSKPPIC